MAKGSKISTQVVSLNYTFIDGEGRNQARQGEEPKMQYVTTAVMKKDGPAHKDLLAKIDAEWTSYKAQFGAKGLPKTNGLKDEMIKDPSGKIDPATEEIAKIPSGNVIATFKTNTTWPDGNPQVVKVFDHKGNDITVAVAKAPWGIGNGTTGIVHGTAMGNNVGGDHKVTLYLTGVQIAKLVKYEGNEIQADEIAGEDIDLGDDVPAISENTEGPNL